MLYLEERVSQHLSSSCCLQPLALSLSLCFPPFNTSVTERHGLQLLHSHARRSLELARLSATDLVCVAYLSVLFLFYFSIKPEVPRLSSTIAERVSSRFPKPSLEVFPPCCLKDSSSFILLFSVGCKAFPFQLDFCAFWAEYPTQFSSLEPFLHFLPQKVILFPPSSSSYQ